MTTVEDPIKKGEDYTIKATLREDGIPKDVSGWTIKAALKDKSRSDSTINGSVVDCTDTGGSNYAAGVIEIPFTDTITTALTTGTYELEIHGVDSSGLITKWFSDEQIKVEDTVIT